MKALVPVLTVASALGSLAIFYGAEYLADRKFSDISPVVAELGTHFDKVTVVDPVEVDEPKIPDVPIHNPDHHVRLAASYFSVHAKEIDIPYLRFISFYSAPPKFLKELKAVTPWWMNQMSFERAPAIWKEVPESKGRLFVVDIRDYGWSAEAWRVVANREPFFREPFVGNKDAEFLRRSIGARQDPVTFHVEAIVRGDWLLRETWETARSSSYYDLLFSKKRFVPAVVEKKRLVEQIVETQVPYQEQVRDQYGRVVNQTKYRTERKSQTVEIVEKVNGFKFVDFPKNKKDWDEAFGIEDVENFLKRQKISVEFGAVVAGMTEDANGSMVARHNRLVEILNVPTGVSLETYDVENNTGKRNYLQQAPDLAQGVIQFDAQELLVSLPNGGQACLLTDGNGNRLEFAANSVATDSDPLDRRVRTPGSCVVCHSPANGLIPPVNLIEQTLDLGLDFKIKDRQKFLDFKGFYLGWKRRIKGYQEPYSMLLDATAKDHSDSKSKALSGSDVGKFVFTFRKWYDESLDKSQAAAELGVPEHVLDVLLLQTPGSGADARSGALFLRIPVPRNQWDVDVFPVLAKILAENKLGGGK